jgi:hypothetical protein
MRHQTRLCIAGALLFIATDCTQRKNPQFQCICTVGSDTLTLHRAEQLVPDSSSAPAHARILRALFECMYAGRIRASASTGTGAQDKQLALDLAQQLSRQNNDAWTPEAAMVLYDAAKYLKSKAAEGQSMLNMLACSESLFTGTVVFCDTGSKGIIISGKDSLFNVWSTQQTTHSMAELLSALLIVPAPTARIVCDFLNSAETSPNTGSDARTMIKGLLFDSSAHRKTETRRAPVPVLKDNSRAVLRYRSQQSIKDSIAVHVPFLESLYKKHLKVHQTMAGTVWVTFQISAQGTVLSARLKTNSITEKDFLVPFQDYLIEKVRFKPVPEEAGPMAFTFPFEFSPEN